MHKLWSLLIAVSMIVGCREQSSTAPAVVIVVFAAASTADVTTEAAKQYMAAHPGVRIDCSFDASSNLARQIHAGAPASIYISADSRWMDELEKSSAIESASRAPLFSNRLVLIAPNESALAVEFSKGFDLASQLPPAGKIALADPAHVPAGRYARQALEHLGWWTSLEQKLLPAQDVRAALRLVERGEADLGIVYTTDARSSTQVKILGEFPPESHERIEYPSALCKGADQRASEFLNYLRSPEAAEIFRRHGFEPVAPRNPGG